MIVLTTDLQKPIQLDHPLTICLGYFDGVHRGHQTLMHYARQLGHPVAVLTFDRNPKTNRSDFVLTPLKTKSSILETLGVAYMIVLTFNEVVQLLTPAQFMEGLRQLGVTDIVLGPDFRFGHQAKGTIDDLKHHPAFVVHVIEPLTLQEEKISTTSILSWLQEANLKKVSQALGRHYSVSGYVGRGLGKVKTLGYPTANIVLNEPFFMPKNGVYITVMHLQGIQYYALASLGFHPTVAALEKPTLEVHVLDYEGDLYEQYVQVEFLHYLRPEQKFASLDALIAQMDIDKATAIALKSKLYR